MILTEANKQQFLDRFYNFYDSVIRQVDVNFRSRISGHRITIIVATRDAEAPENDGWIHVRLHLSGITEFCFTEPWNNTYAVLSDSMNILFVDDQIFVDFGTFYDFHENPERHTKEAFRGSPFYAAYRSISWEVEAYSEEID